MDIILYGMAGPAVLFVSAFLFTFYEDILDTWKYKMRKAKRLIRQMDRSEETDRNAALRISSYNEELLLKEEETACDTSTNTIAM